MKKKKEEQEDEEGRRKCRNRLLGDPLALKKNGTLVNLSHPGLWAFLRGECECGETCLGVRRSQKTVCVCMLGSDLCNVGWGLLATAQEEEMMGHCTGGDRTMMMCHHYYYYYLCDDQLCDQHWELPGKAFSLFRITLGDYGSSRMDSRWSFTEFIFFG